MSRIEWNLSLWKLETPGPFQHIAQARILFADAQLDVYLLLNHNWTAAEPQPSREARVINQQATSLTSQG